MDKPVYARGYAVARQDVQDGVEKDEMVALRVLTTNNANGTNRVRFVGFNYKMLEWREKE